LLMLLNFFITIGGSILSNVHILSVLGDEMGHYYMKLIAEV